MQRAIINRVQVYLSWVGNATVTDPLLFIIRSPPTRELFQIAMEFSDSFQVLKVEEHGFFKMFGNRTLARLETVQGDVGMLSPPETDTVDPRPGYSHRCLHPIIGSCPKFTHCAG